MTDDEMARVWRKLTDNQRLYLMNHSGYAVVPQSATIVAARAVNKLGAAECFLAARWAVTQGYARQDGPEVPLGGWPPGRTVPTWTFSSPGPGRIDPARLAGLAADGHYAAEIARQLGVTRAAVGAAAAHYGLTLARKPKKVAAARPPRVSRPKRIVFMVSEGELSAVETAASRRGLTVSAYLRGVVFDEDNRQEQQAG